MHREANSFLLSIKAIFPQYFKNKFVADFGAADINGANSHLFKGGTYIGIDIWDGPNVKVVCPAYNFIGRPGVDVCISTEMLEHSATWKKDFDRMAEIVEEVLILTCAGPNREEHGTARTSPKDSPVTTDWYRNIEITDIMDPEVGGLFKMWLWKYAREEKDLYFIGFKEWPTPRLEWAKTRYIFLEFEYFFRQRVQRWKRFFKRWLLAPLRQLIPSL